MAGTFTWNIPGCSIEVEREELYAVRIDVAESQQEVRTAWSTASSPRVRYKFKITGRTNVGSPNEVQTIVNLYQSNRGPLSTFTMTDPFDGSSKTCRFAAPLKMKRQTIQWWEMSIEVISVY